MTKQCDPVLSPTRRGFLLGLAAAASLPLAPPASGQTPSPAPPAPGSAPPPDAAPDAAKVDALMALLTLRYGAYLKPEEIPLVRRSIERQETSIAAVLKVPIHNWDAPDLLFIPDAS